MGTGRVEAFSDGVIAVIITIMVLELKAPVGAALGDLRPMVPIFVSYVLSFVFVGIYWNNHHHMLHAVKTITGQALWANLHLLFWLSLTPFVTYWMGENHFARIPVALYGFVLLMTAIAYTILAQVLIRHEGPDSALAKALSSGRKGRLSLVFYVAAEPVAFFAPLVSLGLYAAVSVMWFIPDSRIERVLTAEDAP